MMRPSIGPLSNLVHFPDFESGVIKLQRGESAQLTAEEADAVKCFLLPAEEEEDDEDAEEKTDTPLVKSKDYAYRL